MEEEYENYTPHAVTVFQEGGQVTFPSVGVCRVSEQQEIVGAHRNCQLRRTTYGEIVDLPAPRAGVRYIVSMLVAQVNARCTEPRSDLVYPDTGPRSVVRDEQGNIRGVSGFLVI